MTVNLYEKIVFYNRVTPLPVVIMMDGWDGQVDSSPVTLLRMARTYNAIFCSTARRGFASTGGARDASGREITDIIDGLAKVRALYPSVVSDKAVIFGTSGGGGNALNAACKYPDTWTTVVSCYGMSDYGRDGTNGWYQQNGTYRASVGVSVGGTPAAVPNNYYARDATAAITNFTGGKLFLFHDASDNIVDRVHSDRINSAMVSVGNCTYYLSTAADAIRYTHGHDLNGAAQLDIESKIMATVLSQAAWTVPVSGMLQVAGYLVTKRFSLWLGTGIDEFGQIVYDMGTRVFTITVTTGAATYSLTLKGQTPSTSISATINGVAVSQTSDSNGNVTYTGSV